AGKTGVDLDRREVDVRQVAHRQLAVRHHAEEKDGDHDQRGHDRTADEDFGNVHALDGRWRMADGGGSFRFCHPPSAICHLAFDLMIWSAEPSALYPLISILLLGVSRN